MATRKKKLYAQRMTRELFRRIAREARDAKVSWSEMVRTLCDERLKARDEERATAEGKRE